MLIPCAVGEINLHTGNFGDALRDLGKRKQIESANIAAVLKWLLASAACNVTILYCNTEVQKYLHEMRGIRGISSHHQF